MPVQLGVSKATLYGFFSPLVDLFPMLGVAMTVDIIFVILPDMSGNLVKFADLVHLGCNGQFLNFEGSDE